MDSLIPSTLPSYLKKDLPFSYNIEKAKTLLKESGFENGKGLPEITFAIRNADSVARQQAEFYQLQLAKIGIKIKPITLPFAQFLKDLNKGNFQIFVDGWAFDYPDATNILQMLYSKNISPGANHSNYSNKEFDQLFNELEKEIDPTKQQKILSNIQDIIWNELPWIPIMWSRGMTVFDKKIKNFKPDPLTANNLKYIRID